MAKKNKSSNDQKPNFDGFGFKGKVLEPEIEESREIPTKKKKKKGKTGPVKITPKDWSDTYVKLDPKVKEVAKEFIDNNKGHTLSTLVNQALRNELNIK